MLPLTDWSLARCLISLGSTENALAGVDRSDLFADEGWLKRGVREHDQVLL